MTCAGGEPLDASNSSLVDAKKIVGYVLVGSALGMMFFAFFFVWFTPDEEVPEIPLVGAGTSYSGRVAAISEDSLALRRDDGKELLFQLDANTLFFLWGNHAAVVGDQVRVTFRRFYQHSQEKLRARSVRVLRIKDVRGAVVPAAETPSTEKSPPCSTGSGGDKTASPTSSGPSASDSPTPDSAKETPSKVEGAATRSSGVVSPGASASGSPPR